MTDLPTILVHHVESLGEANRGELITLQAIDERGRRFVLALPYAQAQGLLAPFTAALGAAYRAQLLHLGSEQAIVDQHRLAGIRPSEIGVGRMAAPQGSVEVLLRVRQHDQPFLDLMLPLDLADTLSRDLEAMLSRDGNIPLKH